MKRKIIVSICIVLLIGIITLGLSAIIKETNMLVSVSFVPYGGTSKSYLIQIDKKGDFQVFKGTFRNNTFNQNTYPWLLFKNGFVHESITLDNLQLDTTQQLMENLNHSDFISSEYIYTESWRVIIHYGSEDYIGWLSNPNIADEFIFLIQYLVKISPIRIIVDGYAATYFE